MRTSRSLRQPALSLLIVAAALLLAAPAAGAAVGVEAFDVTATEADGSAARVSGSHPYELSTTIAFAQGGGEDVKDLTIERPAGLIENPRVVEQCESAEFNAARESPFQESRSGESCPDKSQVGLLTVRTPSATRTFGLFNLVPPPGFPALLGASPFGVPIVFAPRIRSGAGEFGLTLEARNVSQQLDITGLTLRLWGNPWLVGHDRQRGDCLNETDPANGFGEAATLEREPQTVPPQPPFYSPGTCSVGNPKIFPPLAYLSLPNSCAGSMVSRLGANSWQQPAATATALSVGHDGGGNPLTLEGCNPRELDTVGSSRPNTDRAASTTGFDFTLDLEQAGLTKNVTLGGRLTPQVRAPSQVKKAVVRLPEGMTLNPSLAAGLGVCTPAQYAAETVSSPPGAACPNQSKIGEMSVESPLFERPIEGGVFLAKPYENPFGSLLALYLVAKAPERGVIVKLPGELALNPGTGRITATFDQLPQLPYTHLNVHFRDGQRSPLATPQACGAYTTQVDLSPWLSPDLAFNRPTDYLLSKGVGGGRCPGGRAPFAPGAESGTLNRNAGSYTPFYLHLTRTDADQEITSYSSQLPPGLLGRIAGVPFCPESAIAAAKVNDGFAETASPSCPEASRIGRTVAGYGIGSVLAYAPGNLYLAGPYNGSPLSIVAVDAATVGPFDLGTIIIRSAIKVDPTTAQVSIDSAGSDPIPHIIKGIPVHLHDIRVYIDRPNFTVNPTSCERLGSTSILTGSGADFASAADDSTAAVTNPFQVSFCSSLDFEPRIDLRLIGGTKRGDYPALRATVTPRPGHANIGKATVTLPPSEFLAQNHIETICTRPQSAAGKCPPGSIFGSARAITPLMDEPLEGPVYLRASGNKLPDLVAALTGRGIRIDVVGRIDSKNGGMRATYDVLPDAPVSKFVLNLQGGRRGLLVNSDDACKAPAANARMAGQNNRGVVLRPRVVNAKCGKAKKRKPAKRGKPKRGGRGGR